MEQIDDLREEGEVLFQFLSGLGDEDWARPTPFKAWTVNQVLAHLHGADSRTVTALTEPDRFIQEARARREGAPVPQGESLPVGKALLARWYDYFVTLCDLLDQTDPTRRVPWFGPDMSVRMMATARQMETWAHGQDVYDLLRVQRQNTDRIRNIAFIGVRTFGFTFANRGRQAPGEAPFVRLLSPSGMTWEWNNPQPDNRVEGDAVAFCHVVTQGRNIADTDLTVVGAVAAEWMSIAQCFAGPPVDPPAPGARHW
ncbi:MAG: TIGR03084 family metal-binding protein [Pseudomonadota bacterium]